MRLRLCWRNNTTSTNMTGKRFILFLSLILISAVWLSAEEFEFRHTPGQKFRIECKIFGTQTAAGSEPIKNQQEYKTVRRIKSVSNDKSGREISEIEDNSYYFNQNITSGGTIELKNTDVVTYKRDQFGKMDVSPGSIFPTMRDLPIFPDKDIQPGYRWTNDALEVQDFFNDKHISLFPFMAENEFVGYEDGDDGKRLAKFIYQYHFEQTNSFDGQMDSRILKVVGTGKTTMFFDNTIGSRTEELYERDYYIYVSNGDMIRSTVVHIVDNGIRVWNPVAAQDDDKIVTELKKKLKKEGLSDTQIVKDDKGIKLVLENIQFEPDSAELLPSEKKRLDKITKLLEQYKNRGLLFVGHTTNRGNAKDRRALSLERAKSVADYIKDKDGYGDTKMYYYGRADKEPIASNETESGRKKNRRVEIFLLDEE
ncbi:MAG: OmpA family protein [Spirochaetales bacterium]|nr:OmpA family protein [Spirochaetales bacterium]